MDSESAAGAPIVFISDASAEAERLTLALRTRGYVVVDVPLTLLAGRVAVQRPAVVVCDADAEGGVDALRKIRELASERPIPVLILGRRDGAIETIDPGLVQAAFARPVNVRELVGTVERLVGVPARDSSPGSLPPSARGAKAAASSRPPGRSNPSNPAPSRSPERSVRTTASAPSAADIPLPPDLAGDAAPRESNDAPVVELARDMQQVLMAAEMRLAENRSAPMSGREEPGPEVDAEGPVPPEVLAALDDALDDEDAADNGAALDAAGEGTGALTGAKVGKRAHTQAGGTAMTGIGTDALGVPSSERSFAGRAGTSVQGTAADLPVVDADSAESGDVKRARQQASTPKPPKPGPEDLKASAVPPAPEPSRASLPPSTLLEPSVPPAPSQPAPSRRAGFTQVEPDPAPRDLTSTTPPVRRNERSAEELTPADRPVARSEPPPQTRVDRKSERPPSRPDVARARERQSDRPASTPHVERPSERPESGPGRERPSSDHPGGQISAGAAKGGAGAQPGREEPFAIPSVLRSGDTIAALARAIRARFTGAIALEVDEGIRRIVLREGDFVTVASGVHSESLVAFLASRGDLPPDVARQAHKLPAFGRRAGAALIAQGHLAQDQLWPVLRAHAEWLIGRACRIERGSASVEPQLIDRLQDEPAVFGGATGAEVLVEVVRRVVPPEEAAERLGGPEALLGAGPAKSLLGECALAAPENERVQQASGTPVREVIEGSPDASLTSALLALVALGVLATEGAAVRAIGKPDAKRPPRDEIDDEALRARILARKALVDEGDYFALLGCSRDATGYDLRRAYSALRKEFEPSRILTGRTADLGEVVDEILEVLAEAHEVLSDQKRRERYRRAIEAVP